MTRLSWLSLLGLLGLLVVAQLHTPTQAQAQIQTQVIDWNLDPNHTQVGFTARHLGFAKVSGEFKKFSAKVRADAKTGKLESVEATAETASVSTGVEKRDNHLRSDDFFNAEKFPQLKLRTKSIKWQGNKFTAKVLLTLRDVTKEVTFTGELLGAQKVNLGGTDQMRAAFEASAKINRKDFGLSFSGLAEGISIVADQVELNINAEISYALPKN
jgi:polyisoprenoid-binding protein YceI